MPAGDSIETLVGKLEELAEKATSESLYWEPDGQFILTAHHDIVAEIPCQDSNPHDGPFLIASANLARLLPAWIDKVKALIKQMPHQSCIHTGFPHTQCGCGRKHELANVCWRCALTALLESPPEEK